MVKTPDARFVYLVEDHGDELLRAARLLAGDWISGEDLLQQSLAYALCGWHDRLDDHAATVRVRQELIATYLDGISDDEYEQSEQDLSDVPATMSRGLADLTPLGRASVVARYYLDLSDVDTAAALDIEVPRARLLASRCLLRLHSRARLAENTICIDPDG